MKERKNGWKDDNALMRLTSASMKWTTLSIYFFLFIRKVLTSLNNDLH